MDWSGLITLQTRLYPSFGTATLYHFGLPVCPVAPSPTCFLSLFRFERDHAIHVYGDQRIAEGFHVLWKNRTYPIAVLNRENKRLIGSLRSSDIHLLLDNDDLFHSRKWVPSISFLSYEEKILKPDRVLMGLFCQQDSNY